MRTLRVLASLSSLAFAACSGAATDAPTATTPTTTASAAPSASASVSSAPSTSTSATVVTTPPPPTRERFNQLAVRANAPLYWVADADHDGRPSAAEMTTLLFYPRDPRWPTAASPKADFDRAIAAILASDTATPSTVSAEEATRRALVLADLDGARATLVRTDFRAASDSDKRFVGHILAASARIDTLYAIQKGLPELAEKIPADDVASQSLFRRDWGPACDLPATSKDARCSAIPGSPKPIVDVYPDTYQRDGKLCETIEHRKEVKALIKPFSVVRIHPKLGTPYAVPYVEAYREPMKAVAVELKAAAEEIATDKSEGPLHTYLVAAAKAFEDGNWIPADEAWAKMSATNSKWYLRVAPDEVYWEPCSHKAGFHLTFARINRDSLAWQDKLTPVEQELETRMGKQIGAPYKARKVTFHLPDFIDIIVNAGDDRTAIGATIGQSLPNFGPVTEQGRGRTVAMSNLYNDADSLASRRSVAASLLTADTLAHYSDEPTPGLLSTILHEATHNLGPANGYKYQGKEDDEAFGGALAATLEELKAQTGALWYLDFLQQKGLISRQLVEQSWADAIVWCLGHIARGMWEDGTKRRPYSQLAAIQIGILLEEGALTFDASAKAANGVDAGAFTLHLDKTAAAAEKMMKVVGAIKAKADRPAAEALAKKFVEGTTIPMALIAERFERQPKVSFVYAVDL